MTDQRSIVDVLLDECDRHTSLYTGKEMEFAQEALNLSKVLQYDIGIYESHFRIARSMMSNSNNEEAIDHLKICYTIANNHRDTVRIARTANSFGIAYYNLGVISKSLDNLLEALEISKAKEYPDIECRVYNNICSILTELGDHETALEYLYSLLGKCESSGYEIFPKCIIYRNLAHTLYRMNRVNEAETFVGQAMEDSIKQENFQMLCESYYIMGEIRAGQKNLAEAKEYLLKALALANETNNSYYLVQIRISLSKLYCEIKSYDTAYQTILDAYNFAMKLDYPMLKRNTALSMAEICQIIENKQMLIEALTSYKEITRTLEKETLRRQQVFTKTQLMLFNLKKDNERLRNEIEQDHLTGCLSGRTFPDRIVQTLSICGNKGSLVFMDVDNLKTINDSYGHDAGDQLLKSFSTDLTRVLPKEALKIRISGDEFIVFIPKAGKRETVKVIDKLIETLALPRMIGPAMMPVLVSAGIALYPDHSTDLISLKKMADAAMYSAKQAGRGGYRIYNASLI
ncbi:MAG: diguanylate cyclase domain-containing protein [Acetivibrionales bacterium]